MTLLSAQKILICRSALALAAVLLHSATAISAESADGGHAQARTQPRALREGNPVQLVDSKSGRSQRTPEQRGPDLAERLKQASDRVQFQGADQTVQGRPVIQADDGFEHAVAIQGSRGKIDTRPRRLTAIAAQVPVSAP